MTKSHLVCRIKIPLVSVCSYLLVYDDWELFKNCFVQCTVSL